MKKELHDLTVEEFVRVICGMEKVYTVELKKYSAGKVKKKVIRGTYDEICDKLKCMCTDTEHREFGIVSEMCEFTNTAFDYKLQLSDIEIYDYLENKTNKFEQDRIKILLREMGMWHFVVDDERMELLHKKIEKGMEVRFIGESEVDMLARLINAEKVDIGNFHKMIDYEYMYKMAFGICYDEYYNFVINTLKRHIDKDKTTFQKTNTTTETQNKQLPDVLNTDDARKYWKKAKEAGFIDENYNFIGTKYQMAYFAELMGEKLGLKHKWKPFTELWEYDKFSQTRRESKERFGYVVDEEKIEKVFG